jgi:hypothetical protein
MRLLLISTLCFGIPCYGFEINDKLINPFTREVYYRYYLIKRCEDPIQILTTHKKLWSMIDFDQLSTAQIEHVEIQDKIRAIQHSHAIEPFIELWHQMNTHRHIYDESFHKDFIKLIFVLYKSLEQPSHKNPDTIALDVSTLSSLEKMLRVIDKKIDTIRANTKNKELPAYKFIDAKQVTTDDIALNYYLIQRLDKSLQILSTTKDAVLASLLNEPTDPALCIGDVNFSHERINYCLSQILIRKNIEPLLLMWQEFIRFRHTGDTHFLKEMLMMLFAVYKDLLLVKFNQESEQLITAEMSTILDLYEHIHELPLDEILHAIDLTTDKLLLLQSMDKKGKAQWGEQYPIVFHTLLALPIAYFLIKTCTI